MPVVAAPRSTASMAVRDKPALTAKSSRRRRLRVRAARTLSPSERSCASISSGNDPFVLSIKCTIRHSVVYGKHNYNHYLSPFWFGRELRDGDVPADVPLLVVDDICDGGGTFIALAKVLRERCTSLRACLLVDWRRYLRLDMPSFLLPTAATPKLRLR